MKTQQANKIIKWRNHFDWTRFVWGVWLSPIQISTDKFYPLLSTHRMFSICLGPLMISREVIITTEI